MISMVQHQTRCVNANISTFQKTPERDEQAVEGQVRSILVVLT